MLLRLKERLVRIILTHIEVNATAKVFYRVLEVTHTFRVQNASRLLDQLLSQSICNRQDNCISILLHVYSYSPGSKDAYRR